MSTTSLQRSLAPLLVPLSHCYAGIMRVRRAFMTRNQNARTGTPCVSIGNIAWGGTGKTPLIEWLMHWAHAKQVRAVVLTRGYKSQTQRMPLQVSTRHSPLEVGDEPLMLATSCPQIPVIVDPLRVRAANAARARLRPELFLLDDGFQHLAMPRQLDLVLLRPEDLAAEWNRVIPAGSWREDVSALDRAGAFLLKASPETLHSLQPQLTARLESFGKPLFSFSLRPQILQRVGGATTLTPERCDNRPYLLVTAVGNPEQVRASITSYMGYSPEDHIILPDHHRFSFKEVERLARRNRMIICTAKDAVKLRQLPAPDVWCLRTELAFGPTLWTDQTFPTWWEAWWEAHRPELSQIEPSRIPTFERRPHA